VRPVYLAHTIAETEKAFRQKFGNDILMLRAAFALATRTALLLRDQLGKVLGSKVLLLVGSGDNGGDALFAGVALLKRGVDVRALGVADTMHELGKQAFVSAGGRFIQRDGVQGFQSDVVLDGIVGTGLEGSLSLDASEIVHAINQGSATVVSIDVPSGVLANSGEVQGVAIQADVTMTIGALKVGLLTGAGKSHAGILDLIDIDVDYPEASAIAQVLDFEDVSDAYPSVEQESYKYSRGVVGLNVGSKQYPGAAFLAVRAALTSGVGMVRIESDIATDVVHAHPEVVIGFDDQHLAAFAIGSGGAGTLDETLTLLQGEKPVVIDAYALQFLKDQNVLQRNGERLRAGVLTVITPHEGEATALGFSGANRFEVATKMARELQVVVVLKGPGTLIAHPDGTVFIDVYGSSSLASAGTGDVLTGLIAGTLAAHAQPQIKLVAAAVALHGLASRQMADSAVASDLIESLTQVRTQMQDTQE